MRRVAPFILVWAAIGGATALAFAYSSGPPPDTTGAPGETTCADAECHEGNDPNIGGTIGLTGAPMLYRAGATYTFNVTLASIQTVDATFPPRNWGFEITAVRNDNGEGAGTFANVDATTSVPIDASSFPTRSYLAQSFDGIKEGAASPVSWPVRWTAPSGDAGAVTFYIAGVAGDGSGRQNDWVYTASVAAQDTTTDAHATSWGALKALYRR